MAHLLKKKNNPLKMISSTQLLNYLPLKVFFYHLPLLQQFYCFHCKHMFDNTNMMTETENAEETPRIFNRQ